MCYYFYMTSVWNSENKTEEESQSSQAILLSETLLLKINQHAKYKFINLICLNTRLTKKRQFKEQILLSDQPVK